MTLPSIARTLADRRLSAEACDEATAKAIVYDAISTDLADGIAWLKSIGHGYNWKVAPKQYEGCIHCEIPDVATRKQVVRLAVYTGLREYVREQLGLHVALHNFCPQHLNAEGHDEGPIGRIIIEPVLRPKLYPAGETQPGNLVTSPQHSWQAMSWGKTSNPPPMVTLEEAEDGIWREMTTNCAEGIAFLQNLIARNIVAESDLSNAPGELIGQMIQLVGVPGIREVTAKKLGVPGFLFYNCCKPSVGQGSGTGRHADEFSWRIQLMNQTSEEMMSC